MANLDYLVPGDSGHLVRRPRVTDAIGRALRCVFRGTGDVPGDMQRLLDRLNRR